MADECRANVGYLAQDSGAGELRQPGLERHLGPATGTALLALDHPNRADSREPSRHASGAGHKLRGLDGAQYILHAPEPCGRGLRGTARIYVAKDRPGHVRQHGSYVGKPVYMVQIATMIVDNAEDGITAVTVEPPVAEDFRPTALMERVSKAAAADPEKWHHRTTGFSTSSLTRATSPPSR